MSAVCETLGVARSNVVAQVRNSLAAALTRRSRPPMPEADLIAQISEVIGELPTYGYRRVHAILQRRAKTEGLTAPNHKRVYRVMRKHDLLLQRHSLAERLEEGADVGD